MALNDGNIVLHCQYASPIMIISINYDFLSYFTRYDSQLPQLVHIRSLNFHSLYSRAALHLTTSRARRKCFMVRCLGWSIRTIELDSILSFILMRKFHRRIHTRHL